MCLAHVTEGGIQKALGDNELGRALTPGDGAKHADTGHS